LIGFCLRQIKKVGRQLFDLREQIVDSQGTIKAKTSLAGRELQFIRTTDLFLIKEAMFAGRPPESGRLDLVQAVHVFDPDIFHSYIIIVIFAYKLQAIFEFGAFFAILEP
jgi:hypothetical protein